MKLFFDLRLTFQMLRACVLITMAWALTACGGSGGGGLAPAAPSATTAAPSFTTQPVSTTIIFGKSSQFIAATSGTPAPTLQWQVSTDSGASWNNSVGETGATLNIVLPPLANSGWQYRAVASNSAGTVSSHAATVTVQAVVPRFAYAANASDNTVSVFSVDAGTGQLRHNGYVAAGTIPVSVTVDPLGKFAYVANH